MYNKLNDTPIKSFLVNLENRIKTIKKLNDELDIKEQYMLQKVNILVNLLYAIDEGFNNYLSSSQNNIDDNTLNSITLYANQLFTDYEFSYEDVSKYFKTLISIYNIIKE